MVKELSDGVTETKYCKNFERNCHWRKLSIIMVWERYCNASPNPEFFLFSLFIFSFISQLIWVRLGWNLHRWFSIYTETSKLMYNWSFLFVVLHKPTLLPSTFNQLTLFYECWCNGLLKSLCTYYLCFVLVALSLHLFNSDGHHSGMLELFLSFSPLFPPFVQIVR